MKEENSRLKSNIGELEDIHTHKMIQLHKFEKEIGDLIKQNQLLTQMNKQLGISSLIMNLLLELQTKDQNKGMTPLSPMGMTKDALSRDEVSIATAKVHHHISVDDFFNKYLLISSFIHF